MGKDFMGEIGMEFGKIVLSTLISYAALFLSAKVVGRKQIAQLDFLDYISGITIGSISAELATDLENMWKPLVALALYGLLTWLTSILGVHCMRSRKFLNGTPTIVLENGKLHRANMKKAKLELSELMVMCRQQGYFDLRDIHTAVFEYNGKLTILPMSAKRPATPADMKLYPSQEELLAEVIMDGRILEGNLRRMGVDAKWLTSQLRAQGYRDASAVFLGLCDPKKALILYPMAE